MQVHEPLQSFWIRLHTLLVGSLRGPADLVKVGVYLSW